MTSSLPEVSVDISSALAHPGDNITLTCRATGLQPGDVIRWVKSVVVPPTGSSSQIGSAIQTKSSQTGSGQTGSGIQTGSASQQEVIAVGETLTPLYERTERYGIVAYKVGEVVWHILDIHREYINQSLYQSINQSSRQSVDQSISQSINWSVSQSVSHVVSQSINQRLIIFLISCKLSAFLALILAASRRQCYDNVKRHAV